MTNSVTVALGMFGLALLGALIAAFYFLDGLIQHEYQFYREAWERDGRPVGFMFRPPEATWLRSSFAFHRCSFAWLFHTPTWVRDDASAKRLLSRLRWFVLIWNIGFIIFFSLVRLHVVAL